MIALLFIVSVPIVEDAARSFEAMARDFREDVRLTVEHEYDRQKKKISTGYEATIKKREVEEKARRASAIATFEAFLKKYPEDPHFTPDAMFRLSELYFERAHDSEEKNRYATTIALYERLLKRFPDYRLADAAYYLMGYCQGEEGNDDASVKAYETLAARFPESRFLPEVWTRIGEYYFDANELAKAANAYTQVLPFKTSPYYDKALYKLAWTEYRRDHYEAATTRFAELLDIGKATDLRGEALQYMGISFAEEEWGGLPKAKAFFQSIKKRPWEHEAFAKIGDVYFDQTKYLEAIEAYKWGISRNPNAPEVPQMQDKVVQAYERIRDFASAARERDVLAATYSEDTDWGIANATDVDAIATARELSEKSLIAAAVFHHRQAQAHKAEPAKAKAAYMRAAQSYFRFLKRFPTAKQRYEMMYFLAESEYFSQQYLQAADMYSRVRDDQSDEKYREPSAYSAVLAAEKLRSKDELVNACDAYVSLLPDDKKSPTIALKAAEVFFNEKKYEEARKRLAKIKTDPADEMMVQTYLAEKNWDAVEKFSEGKPKLKKYRLGAIFKKAEDLDAAKKHEDAAREYIRVVNEDPKSTYADKALNNAAVAYEKVRRFESATRIYERIPKEFPQSPLADYALFRVGINSERFYDFDKAIAAYLTLVKSYPESKHRADSLYNAALALENTQHYEQAEAEYKRYAELFPDRPDVPEVFFRAARVAKTDAVKTYEEFIKRFPTDEHVVEAYLRIGELTQNRKPYEAAVKEANASGKGQAFAAKAQFQLGELAFKDYEAIDIGGSSKQQKNALQKKAKLLTQVRDVYQKTFAFKQVEWTLAALYRIGNLFETFADKLFTAEPPPEIRKLGEEYIEQYRVLLEEQAAPLEDKAVDAYKRTIDEAKKSGVANDWTKRTLKSLNKLRKKEFPIQKDGRYQLETNGFSPAELVGT